jgi:hypothetical protein
MKELTETIAKVLREIRNEYGSLSDYTIIITGDDMFADLDELLGIKLVYCPTVTGFHLARSGLPFKACRDFEDMVFLEDCR